MPRFQWLQATIATVMLTAASMSAQAQLAPAELETLQNLYNATNGSSWSTSTNWMNGGDPCGPPSWHGVVCSADGQHVTQLHLGDNQLAGTLPDLSALPSLQELHLGDNQLSGTLPDLSALTSLTKLNVRNNQLTGPLTTLASLPALTAFWGHDNQFTGFLPDLSVLTSLEYFWVNSNQLSGPIPDISGLSSLRDFRVSTNRLSGTPPAAPSGLLAGGSSLCPNFLVGPSPTDTEWSTATGELDWSRWCETGYLVSVGIGSGGTVSPTPGMGVLPGETAAFTISLDPNHTLGLISSTCGGTLAGNVFTTDPVDADCDVQITVVAASSSPLTVPTLGAWSLLLLAALTSGLGLQRVRRLSRH